MNEPVEPNVGMRIRALREERGLSMRALSERCGLSVNAISRIERGETSPTLSSLHQLAAGLGLRLNDFFREEEDQPVVHVRQDQRRWSRGNSLMMESLGTGLPEQRFEPFLVTVEPGGTGVARPISHTGEEFVHCLEGEVEYRVGEQLYRLEPGDSLLFKASLPHGFRNAKGQPAKVLLVLHADESGAPVSWRHLDM